MGMFDTVIVKGLKLNQPKEVAAYLKSVDAEFPTEFQTKDLENSLSTYYLDQDGSFTYTVHKPTGKKVRYKSPVLGLFTSNCSFIESIYNKYYGKYLDKKYPAPRMVLETRPVIEKYTLSKTFDIYTYEEIGGGYVSLDYQITVNNGKVTKAVLTDWKIESEKEAYRRKKRDQEWKQQTDKEYERQQTFRAKWYYPALRETYNPVVFFGQKLLRLAGNSLIKLSLHWHKI